MHPPRASKYELNLSELRTFQGLPDLLPHQDLQNCPICLEPILSTSVLRELPCTHLFHQSCVDDWVCNFAPKCPICREAFYYLRRLRKTSPAVVESRRTSSSSATTRTGSQGGEHVHGAFCSLKHWCKKRLGGHTQETTTTTDSSHAEQRQQVN
ncbi:hypothetical protein ASPVEDRAFT_145934 [Aspergillus versicolor CBS 583.65]|uniref:RING-type domain-containing protein n=1 Tax=Aspergillus versicolor CBS 583.65 TaxID=1036611 RepID=A0A1L9P4J8_ASPVE|nr:uncharacterized protein ASPVEDRAFT_145934 [Aspergillus versicolor CBS 583.65]OJI96432.1 hypothetical protein ASPVEDRAFT_145934 [Aspergillus versicolor CBS 583.65]